MKIWRWLFLLWFVVSALWITLVVFFVYAGGWFPGHWEVFYTLRENIGAPPPGPHYSNAPLPRPLYEIIRSPAAEKLPVIFQPRGIQGGPPWDFVLNVGQWEPHEFPDGAKLWLRPDLSAADRRYIVDRFWAERWSRWYMLLWPFAWEGLMPPLALFILLWMVKSFAGEVRQKRSIE
jgi:hypothetical protein